MLVFLFGRSEVGNPAVRRRNLHSGSLENAFEELSVLEKSLQEGANHLYNKDLTFFEEFDLINDFGAIAYTVMIDNKLCNIKKIIENIELGYK